MSPTNSDSGIPPAIDFESAPPCREFLELVPFEFAWRHRFCAVTIDNHDVIVSTDDTPASVIARICEQLPRPCKLAQATDEQICRLIARAYEQSRST